MQWNGTMWIEYKLTQFLSRYDHIIVHIKMRSQFVTSQSTIIIMLIEEWRKRKLCISSTHFFYIFFFFDQLSNLCSLESWLLLSQICDTHFTIYFQFPTFAMFNHVLFRDARLLQLFNVSLTNYNCCSQLNFSMNKKNAETTKEETTEKNES